MSVWIRMEENASTAENKSEESIILFNFLDATFKRQLMTYLDTGHRHMEMSAMVACSYCGERFKKGERLYNRMRQERPELFIREKPKFKPSPKLEGMWGQLQDRIKHDKLYREHLELSFNGTPEEKEREEKRANEEFYQRHSGYDKKFI